MSIVNFEEHMKTTGRISDIILVSLNRLHDAKQSGVLNKDELAKLVTLEGRLFSNQVSIGLKTEEDIEDFEKEIPNGKYNCFSFEHENLDIAYETVKQDNTAALFDRENRFSRVKRI